MIEHYHETVLPKVLGPDYTERIGIACLRRNIHPTTVSGWIHFG